MKGSLKPHFKVAQFRLMSEIKCKPFLRPGLSTKILFISRTSMCDMVLNSICCLKIKVLYWDKLICEKLLYYIYERVTSCFHGYLFFMLYMYYWLHDQARCSVMWFANWSIVYTCSSVHISKVFLWFICLI